MSYIFDQCIFCINKDDKKHIMSKKEHPNYKKKNIIIKKLERVQGKNIDICRDELDNIYYKLDTNEHYIPSLVFDNNYKDFLKNFMRNNFLEIKYIILKYGLNFHIVMKQCVISKRIAPFKYLHSYLVHSKYILNYNTYFEYSVKTGDYCMAKCILSCCTNIFNIFETANFKKFIDDFYNNKLRMIEDKEPTKIERASAKVKLCNLLTEYIYWNKLWDKNKVFYNKTKSLFGDKIMESTGLSREMVDICLLYIM